MYLTSWLIHGWVGEGYVWYGMSVSEYGGIHLVRTYAERGGRGMIDAYSGGGGGGGGNRCFGGWA